jgi:hypothetical protein
MVVSVKRNPIYLFTVLPFSVHREVVKEFKGNIKLKKLRPRR